MSAGTESANLDDTGKLSPRVYQLAQLVCRELEVLRASHGENIYERLLPLTLKILEEMNQLCTEKGKLDLDLNLQVAEKNDILFQLERANKLRLAADQRVNYLEDELVGLKKESEVKIEKLESLLRHREMLTRNAEEHALRLEERDAQLQSELASSQDRYNELLRAHVDLLERSRLAGGSECGSQRTAVGDELDPVETPKLSTGAHGYNGPGMKAINQNNNEDGFFRISPTSPMLLDAMRSADRVSSFIDLLDDTLECESVVAPSTTFDPDDDDEANPISEAGDGTENSFGMVKEVEKLINENMELSATKNALNVVKNDLIRKLDDVTGEKLMLIKELESVRFNRDQTRNEANRLVRQVHTCQNKIAHLLARLKLYENVEEETEVALPAEESVERMTEPEAVPGVVKHAASCLVLNSANSMHVPLSTVQKFKSTAAFGGSLNRVAFQSPRDITPPNGRAPALMVTESSCGMTSELDEAMRKAKLGEPCFTKREMSRVLAERNHYKESLMELQDALRYMETMRAERQAETGATRLRSHSNSPVGETGQPVSLARQILSSLRSAADDFKAGLSDLFSELEPLFLPSLPLEAQQHRIYFDRPSSGNNEAYSSELRLMFSHLIGHTAGHSTEAFLGTGNDFAATVSSQSLTNATHRLLNRRYSSSQTPGNSRTSQDASRGSQHHSLTTTSSPIQSNFCTRPMASVNSTANSSAVSTTQSQLTTPNSPRPPPPPHSSSCDVSVFDAS